MRRRHFLKSAACAGIAALGDTVAPALIETDLPIFDTHIHLFDPTRAGGVPWPPATDTVLYKPALPTRYQQVTRGLNVVGAIAIEASPRAADNDWVLSVIESAPIVVGLVGDLVPYEPDFVSALNRLRANPRFLGIRYGNLWDRDLTLDLEKQGFSTGLRALDQAGLAFESANPTPALIATLRGIVRTYPRLTVVVDHLPHMTLPQGPALDRLLVDLRALAAAPRVFIKLSEVPRLQAGVAVTNTTAYVPTLDMLFEIFSEDRILFGSDWPNGDHVLPYRDTLKLVERYIAGKGRRAQEKFFWRNSIRAYQWRPRTAEQRKLVEREKGGGPG